MHDRGTAFVVLLLGDPHLLECGKGSQDGSSNPDRVLPLGRSDDLDLHCGWGQSTDLFLHSVGNTREHSGSSRKDSVSVQILPDVHVALHDGVVGSFVDARRLHT